MNRRTLLRTAGGLSASAALLAGCGETTSTIGFTGTLATAPPAPLRPLDASSGRVTVTAREFAFGAPTIDARAGKLTVTLANGGSIPHEFVVLKTSAAPGGLVGAGGRVSEATRVGKIPETAPGAKRTAVLRLKPGRYLFVCNVVGHYASGMRGQLIVK